MRIPRAEESGGAIINISSLLDVIFILLIFFMATTTFRQEEFDEKVKLPDANAQRSSLSDSGKLIVINVRSANRDGAEPLYVVSSRKMDLKEMHKVVKDAVTANADQKVLIRGDQYAYHGQVADAIATCRQAGIQEVNIGYDFKTRN